MGVRVMGSALGARDATETLLGSANPGESLAPLTVPTAQEQAKGRGVSGRSTGGSGRWTLLRDAVTAFVRAHQRTAERVNPSVRRV